MTLALIPLRGRSFGCTSFCLRVDWGLKLVAMLKFWKILRSFSDTPWTYGMVMLTLFLSVNGLHLRVFLDWSDGLRALLKAQCWYPHLAKASRRCFCSSLLAVSEVMILSARWKRVFITESLCSKGWWESKARYWSVWVGFLYTSNSILPFYFLFFFIFNIYIFLDFCVCLQCGINCLNLFPWTSFT